MNGCRPACLLPSLLTASFLFSFTVQDRTHRLRNSAARSRLALPTYVNCQSRHPTPNMCTDQPEIGNSSFRISSCVILGLVNFTGKTNVHVGPTKCPAHPHWCPLLESNIRSSPTTWLYLSGCLPVCLDCCSKLPGLGITSAIHLNKTV